MKLNISKVIQSLELGGYAEEMQGQAVKVWVNPDLAVLRRRETLIEKYNRLLKNLTDVPEAADKHKIKAAEQVRERLEAFNEFALGDFVNGIHDWFAELWSQSADPATHWTREELVQLNEADPALYQWMKNRSIEMIEAHRVREKKG